MDCVHIDIVQLICHFELHPKKKQEIRINHIVTMHHPKFGLSTM